MPEDRQSTTHYLGALLGWAMMLGAVFALALVC